MKQAKDGYAFMRVVTPAIALEYEIPIKGELTGRDLDHYNELQWAAERHCATIQSSSYETL